MPAHVGDPAGSGDTESLLFSHKNCPEFSANPSLCRFGSSAAPSSGAPLPLVCHWGFAGGDRRQEDQSRFPAVMHHFCRTFCPPHHPAHGFEGHPQHEGMTQGPADGRQVVVTPIQTLYVLWTIAAKNWATESQRGTLDKSMYR